MDIHLQPFLKITSAKGWLPVAAFAAVIVMFLGYYWIRSSSATRCDGIMSNVTIENTGESGWTSKNLHPCVDGLTIRGTRGDGTVYGTIIAIAEPTLAGCGKV
jgi:hypothetical protein